MASFRCRLGGYALASTLVSVALMAHALSSRQHFYSTVIYLTTNKLSLIVLSNQAITCAVAVAYVVKAVFLGSLKPTEMERVNETLRYTIPEICIALTIFREELSLRVLALFASLLFAKFFHVLAEERGSDVEVNGANSLSGWAHLRLSSLLVCLLSADVISLALFGYLLSVHGPSVLILFAFEYLALGLDVVRTMYRYLVAAIAARMRTEWHDKSLYLLYGKLAIDIVKLAVYAMYFALLFAYYGMPVIIIRDLVRSFYEVSREMRNVVASRRLRSQIHAMPTPSPADLETHDPTCSVCMSEVTVGDAASAKLLACGHILHTSCLLEWTQRQQICPMCRTDINAMVARANQPDAGLGVIRGRTVPAPAPAQPPAPPPATAAAEPIPDASVVNSNAMPLRSVAAPSAPVVDASDAPQGLRRRHARRRREDKIEALRSRSVSTDDASSSEAEQTAGVGVGHNQHRLHTPAGGTVAVGLLTPAHQAGWPLASAPIPLSSYAMAGVLTPSPQQMPSFQHPLSDQVLAIQSQLIYWQQMQAQLTLQYLAQQQQMALAHGSPAPHASGDGAVQGASDAPSAPGVGETAELLADGTDGNAET